MIENAKNIAQLTIVIMLVLAALLSRDVWWIGLLLLELTIVIGCGEMLALNLPRRLRQQIKRNQQRADGSKSRRRSLIESQALFNFKVKMMTSLSLIFVPVNACIITYLFFLPMLQRINASTRFDKENEWLEIFLQPGLQMLFLAMVMSMFAFTATRNFYITLLKELDIELASRAEQYAVHDLLHPPSKRRIA